MIWHLVRRIVTDRDTGRQKGFAFIEYYDWQTAQSAIRNLDGYDLNGRKVIVKFAEKDHDSTARPGRDGQNRGNKASMKPKPIGVEAARSASHSVASLVGSPPPVPGGSGELISSALGTKTRAELYEIMAQMRSLVQQNPEQARQILVQNAQLTKALFQAEIMLGMVKGAPVVPLPAPSHPSPAPQPQQQQQPQPVVQHPPQQQQPVVQHPPQQQQHYAPQHPSPPVQHPQHYAPQPLPPPQQPQPGPGPYHQPPAQHGAIPNGSYAPQAYGGVPAPAASGPQPMDPRAPPAAQMSAPMDPRAAQHSQPMDAWNGGQGPTQGQGYPAQHPPPQQQQLEGQQYGMPQPQPQYMQQPQPHQPDQQMPPAEQMGLPPGMDEDTKHGKSHSHAPLLNLAASSGVFVWRLAALIQQVMQLTPEQVAGLPPEQQAQVMVLRDAVVSVCKGNFADLSYQKSLGSLIACRTLKTAS
ncbi:hypothetical protein COCSUDRAFT_46235 [Coccomyxa subellipsoidea C-169]|uniref:RRM domain-containing protein n=1 Tax=Coccomyxa subellipsoidea (strain C-169) TaxID=574566 RepID=I0Z833_COCSC|nr:hypothetical protein COCSUDRAFT_46235 [Coccomyxa subellipsoidea C-169]EIE26802.1 hypothetical protein COCSUDRAFT_46235 [Coccomyxa subellipsoidea C-169]|eukprot:XP_005651346.1 hypothetical protein COCSUDRAFT_46235 [Coccomyxa subellipsoidea C-169]